MTTRPADADDDDEDEDEDEDEQEGCECCCATHRAEWTFEGAAVCIHCYRILRALDLFAVKRGHLSAERVEQIRNQWQARYAR